MSQADVMMENMLHFNWRVVPKTGVLVLIVISIVFDILVLRQIQLMNRIVTGTSSLPLKVMGVVGLLLTILLFIVALSVL